VKKFLVGVYVGASAVFMYGMFIEIQRFARMNCGAYTDTEA